MCGLPSHHDGCGSRTTGAKHSQVSSPPTLPSPSLLTTSFSHFSLSFLLFPDPLPSPFFHLTLIAYLLPSFSLSLPTSSLFLSPSSYLSLLLPPSPHLLPSSSLPPPFLLPPSPHLLPSSPLPLSTPPSSLQISPQVWQGVQVRWLQCNE